MRKIIFSDIDGTLVHKIDYGTNLVQVPKEPRYISQEAIDQITELREDGHQLAIITGRRKSGFERLGAVMPYDLAIIEHGCVILKEGDFDPDWAQHLENIIGIMGERSGPLWDYESHLLKEGYKTDSNGRYASFRVFKDQLDNFSEFEKQKLETKVKVDVGRIGLTTTRNGNMIDILPVKGGKANAIMYILSNMSLSLENAIALGDELNDESMMSYLALVACPGNAKTRIKQIVENKGGYVSHLEGHEGTIDMLKQVRRLYLDISR